MQYGLIGVLGSSTVKTMNSARNRFTLLHGVVVLLAACLPLTTAAGGALDERVACWEGYNDCALGAGNADQWRSVCYADYSSCMKNPGEVQCRAEDRTLCETVHRECNQGSDGSTVSADHCNQDHKVCLDSRGC